MRRLIRHVLTLLVFATLILELTPCAQAEGDPLPSENLTVPQFFDGLFEEFQHGYKERRSEEYAAFSRRLGLAAANPGNQRTFHFLFFLHDLFTGRSAEDFSRGGMLRIPYFWHWVQPNPRHGILRNAGRERLDSLPPPKEFNKYRSFADIDRVPSLYLSDLVSPEPGYYHPDIGPFYTFGWCSEREMAFVLLLSLYDFHGKIKQTGVHVWSEFWLPFASEKGPSRVIVARIDNTFDEISWHPIGPNQLEKDWSHDLGDGAQVQWYNRIASSEAQRRKVRRTPVEKTAAGRIRNLVYVYPESR
jgi:hypothetical protein